MTDGFSDSIVVAAAPDDVYALVTDVGRTGEWSPVCTGCEWDEGSGPFVGGRFTGHNAKPGREWSTTSEVVAAVPGRTFGWDVNGGLVHWRYDLEPVDGGTRVTESWELREAGLGFFRDKYGDTAEHEIATRTADAHSGIPATLATIKRILETG